MIQYHILQTNIKRTVWQRVKFLPFEIPSIQCVPFLVVKFTSIVPLIMAENGLKFLKILLPAVIKIRENTVLVFQYILRFWNQTSIVNSFLNISHKCSLVNKSSKFSLQVSVSSFNKVVLHISFSELSLLLSFQGWQEQVPNSHTSAAKDRPNSDYDAGNNVMLFSVRKIYLAG